ncbi:hypothetical protein ABZ079_05830 [Streptomyces sp. NPDC006314]|uniref:hypothetical protein n=1 Tax=Streptomyces sp. NPDC006314 TaxID=3154475 RepID=UPI00339EE3B4
MGPTKRPERLPLFVQGGVCVERIRKRRKPRSQEMVRSTTQLPRSTNGALPYAVIVGVLTAAFTSVGSVTTA